VIGQQGEEDIFGLLCKERVVVFFFAYGGYGAMSGAKEGVVRAAEDFPADQGE
jgi:hypothetical protein